MWWDSYKRSKARVFQPNLIDPVNRDEHLSDADRGVLLIMALVMTPVIITATFVVGLAN